MEDEGSYIMQGGMIRSSNYKCDIARWVCNVIETAECCNPSAIWLLMDLHFLIKTDEHHWWSCCHRDTWQPRLNFLLGHIRFKKTYQYSLFKSVCHLCRYPQWENAIRAPCKNVNIIAIIYYIDGNYTEHIVSLNYL